MQGIVVWLRYMLIASAMISTTLLTSDLAVGAYLTHMLVFLLLAQAEFRMPHKPGIATALSVAQTVYGSWIAHTYEGLSYFVFFSILISVFQGKRLFGGVMLAFQLVALNIALSTLEPTQIVTGNTAWILMAGLLYAMERTANRSEEMKSLYDQLRSKHYELQDARKRLVEHAKQVEVLSAAEERNRISRDLHDEVGHRLIRLKMMMEAVVRIMPDQRDKAEQMAIQVRDQLADCMEILRDTVRRVKPVADVSQLYSLDRLIEGFAADSGVRVEYRIEGLPFPLYPSEELILYRNAQEAITNAIRHGQANEVRILLQFGPNGIAFYVSNNGRLPSGTLGPKGLGLTGMEERVRLYGGELVVKTDPDFCVVTRLPRRHAADV